VVQTFLAMWGRFETTEKAAFLPIHRGLKPTAIKNPNPLKRVESLAITNS